MRSLIVHNLRSGFGSSAIYEFERAIISEGDECVLRSLAHDSAVAEVLADAEEFDLVVISAGDGTVTNALYALRNRDVKTCVFPTGTANLLFSNLGNAPEPAAIAKACLTLAPSTLDLGELSWTLEDGTRVSRGFGIMSGMGFDAQMMRDAKAGKHTLGEAAYFAAALANLRPEIATFTIEVDGKTYERQGISCIVANTAMIQGEINILPGCRMDDGMIDVMVLESTAALQLLLPIMAGIIDPKGSLLGRPHIEQFKGREVRVRSSIPLPLERDGDVIKGTYTGYEARCLPACNQIVVDEISPYYQKP